MIKPVVIGQYMRKGIFALRDVKQGGFNVAIVRLIKGCGFEDRAYRC